MKKFAIILAAFVLGVSGLSAKTDGRVSNRLIALAGQYKHYSEFEVVKLGPLALNLIKWVSDSSDDIDDEDTWAMVNGVRKIVFVEYADADAGIKNEFNAKVSGILENSEVLMEAKDDGDIVRIYGNGSDNGTMISDLIIYIPSDGALLCLFGKIAGKDVESIVTGSRNFR